MVTPAPARTSRARSEVRRSDQRRDAVVALYQRDVTGRPLAELLEPRATAFTRELVDGVDRETEPGLKGDTASGGGDKPATLESGVIVRVPLFVNVGDRVRVDTRSGAYVSRA